ncbi:acyltransferase family protein [Prevotella sp. E13-17]|uniref:acyltransferase family protein n=1 Tax=Prevotella sp. E13-17 TaxID=2913616 RepID=UPI00351D8F99
MNVRKFNYLDVAKVLTCFLVVIGHVFYRYKLDDWLDWGGHNIYLAQLAAYIYSFHMPLFFIISGYVYGKQMNKNIDYSLSNETTFINKKVKRLMVPFFCFSIPLTAVLYYVGRFQGSILENYCHTLLLYNDTYLWFLPCLFVISILYNSLRTFIRKRSYLCLLVFIVLYVISDYLPSYLSMHNIAHYLIYYHVGAVAQLNEKQILKLYKAKNIFVFFLLHLIFFYLVMKTWGYIVIHNVLGLGCAMLGSLLMLTISNLISNEYILHSKIVGCFIRDSYSVYLIHPMLIYLLYFYIFKNLGTCYTQFILSIIICYGVSILFAFILRRLNCAWIIGEKNVTYI